jgi:hypothetical protein
MKTKIEQIRLSRIIALNRLITVEKLKTFQLNDFKDPAIYQMILETIADPQFDFELQFAANFLFALKEALESYDKDLKQNEVKLYKGYQEIINYLEYLTLPLVAADQIEKLFSQFLMFAYEWGVDIESKILFLFTYFDFDSERISKVQQPALRGLKNNKEKLGDKEIKVDNIIVSSYISNWLKDYDYFSGGLTSQRILEEIAYLNQSFNVRTLDNNQKEILRQLIRIYNILRFPVLITNRRVITTGHHLPKVLSTGSREINNLVTSSSKFKSTEEQIIEAYQSDINRRKLIDKAEEKLVSEFGDNISQLRAEFFVAVQKKNVARTVACLRLMAQKDDFEKFLREDIKLNRFLAAAWAKQFGQEFASEFNQDPGQLKFIRQFLRYVLQERLGLEQNEAARIGLQIGNILVGRGKKGYNKMAYFEVKSQGFKWFEG